MTQAEETGGRLVPEIWRYLACMAVTALVSLLFGQFLPNRNIVTSDQLDKATVTLQQGQAAQAAQIGNLSTEVARLSGALDAKNKTTP